MRRASTLATGLLLLSATTAGWPAGPLASRVRNAALKTYVHGMTEAIARSEVGPDAGPILHELLDEPGFPRRDNVVAFLGYLGGSESTPHLIASLTRGALDPALAADDRAALLVPVALGRIAGRGDRVALRALLALTRRDAADAALSPKITIDLDLARQAVLALAFTGASEALARLAEIERNAKQPHAPDAELASAASAAKAILGRPPEPAPEVPASTTSGYPQDPNARIHQAGITWANHVALSSPVRDADGRDLLDDASGILGTARDDADVACCATLAVGGLAATFGAQGDGLDVVDDEGELTTLLDLAASRVKIVRLINWCGAPGDNIIGCSPLPGNGMVVVSLGSSFYNSFLWAHEYGHNLGLPHRFDPNALMYPILNFGERISQTECAAFHAPPPATQMTLLDRGACTQDDDSIAAQFDNCPSVTNDDQFDSDGDGKGNACDPCPSNNPDDPDADGVCENDDNCRGLSNPDQADADADHRGDPCDLCPLDSSNDGDADGLCANLDNCPTYPNPAQEDADADGTGDICDNCPAAENASQLDTDGDWEGDACDRCPFEAMDDFDGDQLCAPADRCENAFDPDQADRDGDGIGDVCDVCPEDAGADADMDGVCDAVDLCAGAPDTAGAAHYEIGRISSMRVVGDVNQDGHEDLLVGDSIDGVIELEGPTGRVSLFAGSSSGIDPQPIWSFTGDRGGLQLGTSVASGDFNGDGFVDLVAAGKGDHIVPGRVSVFLGSAGGPSPLPEWSADATQAGTSFGFGLAVLDVNGDGFDDLVVGEPTYSQAGPGTQEGRVLLYYGSSSGLSYVPDWSFVDDHSGETLGRVLDNAGDVNGDGFDELVVGSPTYYSGSAYDGRAYVFMGSSSGPSYSPDWIGTSPVTMGSEFGTAVAGVGDVDGDGYDDLAVGAAYEFYPNGKGPERFLSPIRRGAVYLFRGGPGALGATADWVGHDASPELAFGDFLTATGDFDADGLADFLVTASEGRTAELFKGAIDTAVLPIGWRRSMAPFQRITTAGDVDGDGRPDILLIGHYAPAPTLYVYGSRLASNSRVQADRDADLIGDACDLCPDTPDPLQVDADGDRVGDLCDNCPATPNADQADLDGDGVGEACESGLRLVDVDGSGRIDGFDLARLGYSFGTSMGHPRFDPGVDFDRNGTVDGVDLSMLAAAFGGSTGAR